jgi:hypothetical protein
MCPKNSLRVAWLCLKVPSIALVTIRALAFFTPRMASLLEHRHESHVPATWSCHFYRKRLDERGAVGPGMIDRSLDQPPRDALAPEPPHDKEIHDRPNVWVGIVIGTGRRYSRLFCHGQADHPDYSILQTAHKWNGYLGGVYPIPMVGLLDMAD